MRRIIAMVLLGLGLTSFSWAEERSATINFSEANSLYEAGKFDSAVVLYSAVLEEGPSLEAYYNLGNCHYRLGNTAEAVLNYERALRISPRDEDVLTNLKFANLLVKDKVEAEQQFFLRRWWNRGISAFSSKTWTYMTLALVWLSMLLAAGFLFASSSSLRRATFFSALVCFLLCVVTLTFAFSKKKLDHEHRYGILMTDNIYVLAEPNESSLDQFILHEGIKVQLLDNSNGWQEIRLNAEKVGWVPEEVIEEI